jgi:hypothetical protein
MHVAVSQPAGDGTTRTLQTKLPPYIAPDFSAFGYPADQCPNTTVTTENADDTVAFKVFRPSVGMPGGCPDSARVGKAIITTPLLDGPVVGDVYLINSSPIPWLGIEVDPNVDPGNPQGVTIGLVGFTDTPFYDSSCVTSGCPKGITANFTSLPDVPLSSVDLQLGGVNMNRVGVGNVPLPSTILLMAQPDDAACRNVVKNANFTFSPWSGNGDSMSNAPVAVTGCNDPTINITAPADPTGSTSAGIYDTNSTSVALGFNLTGGATSTPLTTTIPAGTTCTAKDVSSNGGAPTTTTTPVPGPSASVTVPVVTGVNSITVTCVDALGQGTSVNTKTIYKDIPAVRITSPLRNSSVGVGTVGVGLALTIPSAIGGANQSAIPSGTTCTIAMNGGAPVATTSLLATFSTNQKTLVAGTNTITAACTNAAGTGSATSTVNLVPPALILTSPTSQPVANAGSSLTTAITFRINSLTYSTFPAGITCSYSVNGGASVPIGSTTIPAGTITGLTIGTNNLVITCTNVAGSGTLPITINRTS